MGRRSLRKIDPRLDLSRNLKTFGDLPRPWDAALLFGRRAPLEIEIGSGKGLFLREAAAARPDADFLGIEIAPRYARFSAAALARRGLTNAIVVVADALRVLAEIIPDESLAAVHIYFPDPWWKQRHKKRRVMCPALVRNIQRVLQPGGTLRFWTDVEEYFQTSLALLAGAAAWEGPFEEPEVPAHGDMDYRTHFERRTRLQDAPVHRALFRKK